MNLPPIDPRDRTAPRQPTWRNVIAANALLAVIPLALWAYSNPLAGAALLTGVAGLVLATRRTLELVRCVRRCGGFAFELGQHLRVTVTQRASDGEPTEGRTTNGARTDGRRPAGCC